MQAQMHVHCVVYDGLTHIMSSVSRRTVAGMHGGFAWIVMRVFCSYDNRLFML